MVDLNQFFQDIFENNQSELQSSQLLFQEFNQQVEMDEKGKSETKNIPKNIGVFLKNYLKKYHKSLCSQNSTIRKFLQKGIQRKYYNRKDLKILFQNQEAKQVCSEYFIGFEFIDDVLRSQKISNIEIVLKYTRKLFMATLDPNTLQQLKYPQQ